MKKITFLVTALFVLSILAGCGSGESNKQSASQTQSKVEDINSSADKAKVQQTKRKSEAVSGLSAEEFGKKALKAIQDQNLEKVKNMVSGAMAVNMTANYLKGKKEKYLSSWDGRIKGVKYRKDKRSGLLQAVVYYKETKDKKLMVHILDHVGDSGKKWYALGGAYGFEKISKEKYDDYAMNISEVQ